MPHPLRLLLALGALLAAPLAVAQPLNDFLTRAVPLVVGSVYPGTTVGATSGGGNTLRGTVFPEPKPSCLTAAQSAPNSVWYWFSTPADGTLTFSTAGSGFDTVLSVYRYDATALTEVACNDDQTPGTVLTSRVEVAALGRLIYFVRVAGFSGATGSVTLAVSPATLIPEPPDDSRGYGLDFNGDGAYPATIVGATQGGTGDPAAACVSAANDGGNSVWRYVRPTSNATVTISTLGSSFDTILSVLRADPGNVLTEVACNDDIPGNPGPSSVTVALTAGQEYYVRVVGYQGAEGIPLRYTVSGLGPAPVDAEPAASAALTALQPPAPNPTAGTTTLRATLATAADVDLAVYDLLGRRVATLASGPHPAGALDATWDAATVPPGVYLARLTADGTVSTQRLTVAR